MLERERAILYKITEEVIAGPYVSQLVTNPVTRLVTFDNSILAVRPYLNSAALAFSGVHVITVRAVFAPVTNNSGWRGRCAYRVHKALQICQLLTDGGQRDVLRLGG